ncbi:MAG TPA: class I SAM-dependent methyltransferase, partial [Actinomycetota bacterium]
AADLAIFGDDRFDLVCSLLVLQHVRPGYARAYLREFLRVLRPGGVLVGTDGTDTPARRELHTGDVFLPVAPDELPGRLEAAGFAEPAVALEGDRIRFAATAPDQARR